MAKEQKERKALAESNVTAPDQQASENSANVTIILCTAEGAPLAWSEVQSVTAWSGDLCGRENQACPLDITQGQTGQASFLLATPARRMVQIGAAAKYAKSGKAIAFVPVVTSVDCGETLTANMLAAPSMPEPAGSDTSPLAIQAHWCVNKNGRRDRVRAAEIVSATAELMPKTRIANSEDSSALAPQAVFVRATMHGGVARFALLKRREYKIDVRLKENYARSCPPVPFTFCVGRGCETEMSLYFEACERVVALFFANSCGHPANPDDIYVEGDFQPLTLSPEGAHTLNGAEVGRVRFSSNKYQLSPSEIYVDERMTQAHAIQVTPRAVSHPRPRLEEVEEFIFGFDQKPRGEASVEVLSPDGELVATLTADSSGEYHFPAKPNDEFDFVARMDGRVIERIRMKA
jgi:hypothetical protein